jgi:hypothetical protein
MISPDDAKTRRIIGLAVQTLRALGRADSMLLNVLFKDSRLNPMWGSVEMRHVHDRCR